MAPSVVARVPQGLWSMITSYSSSISKHVLAEALGHSYTSEEKHSRLWNLIFRNEEWLSKVIEEGLNPVLIGRDLNQLYHNTKNSKPTYLALVIGHPHDGGKDRRDIDSRIGHKVLYSSLRPYRETEDFHEIFLLESKITLNIYDVRAYENYTLASSPGRLVLHKRRGLHSTYLYWKNRSFVVGTIGPENIVGIIGASPKKSVAKMVGLTWLHPPEMKARQHFFAVTKAEMRADQLNTDSPFHVTGWKWKPEWEKWGNSNARQGRGPRRSW